MENTIKQWIDNPNHDYNEGIALFVRYGGNRFLSRYFENTQPRFAIKKLVYEMGQLVKQGKGYIESPEENSQRVETNVQQPPSGTQLPDPITQKQKSNIPEVAAIAKRIVHETWVEMSRITNELFDLGTENDDATVSRRKALLDERIPLIERYNEVYEAKESFFAGEMTEEQLSDIVMGTTGKEPEPPADYSKLSDLELSKKMHAAQTAMTRYNNQLLYQSNKKEAKENRMPDCPKRKEIKNSLAIRSLELEGLKVEFEKRCANGNA